MLVNLNYNRDKAVQYALKWALKRNPKYYNFDSLGGDCTNFISQCIYAGSNVMNFTKTLGWYYISPNNRSASWSGVKYLYNFLTTNKKEGPYAVSTTRDKVKLGDVVQLGDAEGHFYHSLLITKITDGEIYINTHTNDSHMRPLSTYYYGQIRFLHIQGVRKWQ